MWIKSISHVLPCPFPYLGSRTRCPAPRRRSGSPPPGCRGRTSSACQCWTSSWSPSGCSCPAGHPDSRAAAVPVHVPVSRCRAARCSWAGGPRRSRTPSAAPARWRRGGGEGGGAGEERTYLQMYVHRSILHIHLNVGYKDTFAPNQRPV